MRIIILPSAREDLGEGFGFYECQEPGVGAYFLKCLFADIDSLESHAGIHRKAFGYNRLLSKRFPYAVYYSVDGDVVSVRAVLDCRRDPAWIRRHLK
ncbi:MAG: type II toxin-antitoxin system RelE/ParE family toxin [Limisphaerales bacterium]